MLQDIMGEEIEIIQTEIFAKWLNQLRDERARVAVMMRLDRMSGGNMGDRKAIGNRVFEARINYGPGYRLYYAHEGEIIVIMLCGGDKSSQSGDIARAKRIAAEIRSKK